MRYITQIDEFEDVYTPIQREKISNLLFKKSGILTDKCKSDIADFNIYAWFVFSPSKSGNPSRKQTRKYLKDIEVHSQLLLQIMKDLNHYAREALQNEALQQFGPYIHTIEDINAPTNDPFNLAERRFFAWIVHLEQIRQSVVTLRQRLGRSGTAKDADRQWAVEKLYKIWIAHAKDEPKLSYNRRTRKTTGPFLEFCEVVLEPIVRETGTAINLERAVRDKLYG